MKNTLDKKDLAALLELQKLLGIKIECVDYGKVSPIESSYSKRNGQIVEISIADFDLSEPEMRFAVFNVLARLKKLRGLSLHSNRISNISSLQNFSQLTDLSLWDNQITDVTPLQGLTNLAILDLSENQITDIAPLQGLTQLGNLYLGENQITNITPLKSLTRLMYLYLDENQITDIIPLQGLTQLVGLRLSKNHITDITPLQGLTQLRMLKLQSNRIDTLPLFLTNQFKNITVSDSRIWGIEDGVHLHGNPLTDPPMEVIEQGHDAIARYFERKEKEAFTTIREAKLILVGDGAAGKTSLKNRLQDPAAPLPEAYERTRGIEICDWEFEDGFIAHIWDFGGQDVYYPVHRFFFSENTLFVLLASTRTEQHNFEYWIPTIFQFGGKSPIIIGQTCFDGHKMQWNDIGTYTDNAQFNVIRNGDSFFHQIHLSKDKNEGLDNIKCDIIHQAKKLPHFSKEVPLSWVEVREKLAQNKTLCIHYSEFVDICRALNPQSFSRDEDCKDCCSFLHNIGFLFWYHQNNILREWVVLKPELAVEAVYKIIDDEDIINRSGLIQANDFARLWADTRYKNHHNVLKEMLKEFRVAFSKKHSDSEYILPTLLKSIPKERNWNETKCITIEYEFKFMPRAIVNQLSAEMSKHISIDEQENQEVWNNAVNFIYANGAKCQVKEDLSARKIIIKATGDDARGLIMLTMDALDTIISKYRGVGYEILIPCTCVECARPSEHITKHKYNDLTRRFREKGIKIAHCNESGNSVPIRELLYSAGLFFVPDLRGKGDNNVKKISIFLASSQELEDERREFELFIYRLNKKLVDSNIFLNLEIWEDFIDAMSPTRLQDEYNKAARESDIFISLFSTKAGKFTVEEFESAYSQFKSTGNPYVYVYFKNAEIKIGEINKNDLISLFEFEEKVEALGHFPTRYTDISDLKNHFRSQLDKLLEKL